MLTLLSFVILIEVSVQEPPKQASGSICVASLPKKARETDHDYPGGKAPREYAYKFTVQLDSHEPVEVGKQSPVLIGEVSLDERHRIVIRDAGKIIESFSFTFEKRGSTHLCLAYGPWYQTWTLEPPQQGQRWCSCRSGAATK